MKRALVSVSDKTNLVEFVSELVKLGYEIISTGGTKKALEAAGIETIGISEITGFPEIMDGRVKTLHPKVHGALLCVRDNEEHVKQLKELNIDYIDLVCVNLYPFKQTVQKPGVTHEDGALLCVRDNEEHVKQLKELNIDYIDLVCVNLYPFKQTVQKPGVTHEEIIENIDIGGPSMLRSASKNYKFIPVVVDPNDYEKVIEELKANGETTLETREKLAAKVFRHTANYDAMIASYLMVDPNDYEKVIEELKANGETTLETREKLAAKVFRHTANYDAMIASYLTEKTGEKYPEKLTITYDKVQDLRYGENPHQSAAFYKNMNPKYSLANAKQLHGKELSYNNIQDGNAAIEILKDFEGTCAAVGLKHMNPCGVGLGKTIEEAWDKAYEADPDGNAAIEILKDFEGTCAAVGLKHMNPCGVGLGKTIEEAWDKAYEADPVSIFGGIVAFNEPVNKAVAEKLANIFLEIIIAPAFDEDAFEILSKKKNIRLMQLDTTLSVNAKYKVTNVNDGLLVQDVDDHKLTKEDLRCVTNRKPTEEELEQLLFAWNVVKHVKSNAIVLVKDNMTIGVGAGQMNRVGAARIAIEQAQEKAKGSVMGSDAFFPMPDTVEEAVKAGVTAIIQPGGSIKDQLSIDVCNEYGIAMVYTGVRHFKH